MKKLMIGTKMSVNMNKKLPPKFELLSKIIIYGSNI